MHFPFTLCKKLLALGFLLLSFCTQAQTMERLSNSAEDSLKHLLRKSQPDTNRVNLLLQLGNPSMDHFGMTLSNLEVAYQYNIKADLLSRRLKYSKGQILANYHLAYVFLQKEEYDKSREYVKKGIQLAKEKSLPNLEAQGWHYLGDTYDGDGLGLGDIYKSSESETIHEKIRCFEQAIHLFGKAGNKESETEMRLYLAHLFFIQGRFAIAEDQVQQAKQLLEPSDFVMLQLIYHLLSLNQSRIGNYSQALNYGLAALNHAVSAKDSAWLYAYHLNLANIYLDLKQPDEAEKYFERGLWHAQNIHYKNYSFTILSQITRLLQQLGKANEALHLINKKYEEIPAEKHHAKMMFLLVRTNCYLTMKKYDLAEAGITELIKYYKTRPDQDVYKMFVYGKAGSFFLEKKAYDEARSYIEKAILLNLEHRSLNAAMHHQLLLFKLDSAKANYIKAIEHYQQYTVLNDSIYSEKNSQQIASLQIQHETKEKEKDIALLTKRNEIQQANLEKKDLYQRLTIGGALMLLLLLSLSYNRYRLNKKSTNLLEEKQHEINQKNQSLQLVLQEKDELLKEKENLLRYKDSLLVEKEWLLKEIHHRVKNNLQIVMSLLNSQAAYLQDGEALAAIQESQQRVQTISLIHQKLYQSEKVALIEMGSYIREVTEYLSDTFNLQNRIRFHFSVVPLELEVAIAVPLGLLINEAVTNCLKYAFPGERTGTISITISQVDGKSYLLSIADDGVGLNPKFDLNTNRSLGMSLIRGLSRQLGGGLKIENNAGLKISLLLINLPLSKTYAVQA